MSPPETPKLRPGQESGVYGEQHEQGQGTAGCRHEPDGALFDAEVSVGYAGVRSTTFILPDPQDGPRLRDAGTARARDAAPAWWTAAIDGAIGVLASQGSPFTADDVHRVLREREPELPEGGPTGAQWGAAFRAAAQADVIRRTGRYVPTTRPLGRGRVLAEWAGASR